MHRALGDRTVRDSGARPVVTPRGPTGARSRSSTTRRAVTTRCRARHGSACGHRYDRPARASRVEWSGRVDVTWRRDGGEHERRDGRGADPAGIGWGHSSPWWPRRCWPPRRWSSPSRGSPASAAPAPPGCGGSRPHLTVQGSGRAARTAGRARLPGRGERHRLDAPRPPSPRTTRPPRRWSGDRGGRGAGEGRPDTELTINPDYTTTNGQIVITGYGVTNSISVRCTKLAPPGSVIDAASAAGWQRPQHRLAVSFARADPRTLQDRARQDAVHQAVTHAAAMARAAGERLGWGVLAHRPVGRSRTPSRSVGGGAPSSRRRGVGAARGRDPAGERPGDARLRARAASALSRPGPGRQRWPMT